MVLTTFPRRKDVTASAAATAIAVRAALVAAVVVAASPMAALATVARPPVDRPEAPRGSCGHDRRCRRAGFAHARRGGTRYVSADSCLAAGMWIRERFLEYGYTDVGMDTFRTQTWQDSVDAVNVVARKRGSTRPSDEKGGRERGRVQRGVGRNRRGRPISGQRRLLRPGGPGRALLPSEGRGTQIAHHRA